VSELFKIEGPNLDLGYINLREGKSSQEREIGEKLEEMWRTYEPYADPDFTRAFARDPEGRFWEMYLGCTLLAADKILLPRSARQTTGGQPDICVTNEERRIWIEAMVPDCGTEGPDRFCDCLSNCDRPRKRSDVHHSRNVMHKKSGWRPKGRNN
jgi:hypothetical protein